MPNHSQGAWQGTLGLPVAQALFVERQAREDMSDDDTFQRAEVHRMEGGQYYCIMGWLNPGAGGHGPAEPLLGSGAVRAVDAMTFSGCSMS